MSLYENWLRKHGILENMETSSEKFGFGASTDFANDNGKSQAELFSLAMAKYPEDCNDFFSMLANKDEEISVLYQKLDRTVDGSKKPIGSIMPPTSDTGV